MSIEASVESIGPRAGKRAQREQWVARQLENGRRAAECAAVGLLWTAFSLPIVTAGAAWLAAATIFDGWARDEEPHLVATFVAALRGQLRVGFLAQVVVAVVAVIGYFDIRFAGAAHIPGAHLDMAALALLVGAALGIVGLALAERAHTGSGPRDSLRGAWALAGAAPWALPLTVFAIAVCAALIAIIPALLLLVAGPLAFAVSVVHTRGRHRLEAFTNDSAGPDA